MMNNRRQRNLRTELRAAGASDSELAELSAIALSLGTLQREDPTVVAAKKPQRKRVRIALGLSIPAVVGLALGMFLVIASQTVLPGSPLYPMQAGSDSVAAALDPTYKGTIMMKRAAQVKELVDTHAPSSRVYATLADYKKQAASYKSVASNYAAFEYCKNNLQQATAQATDSERQAINKTLSSLADV